jgi:hypothetical protein
VTTPGLQFLVALVAGWLNRSGPQKLGRIERRARIGGLLNFYDREAA